MLLRNVLKPVLSCTESTAMTVVAIMILSALSLDSWMPRTFCRKKYRVTATAMKTDAQFL